MTVTRTTLPAPMHSLRRWLAAAAYATLLTLFFVADRSLALSEYQATALNDVAWALACATAALLCHRATKILSGREQLTWRLFTLGLVSWLAGHGVWTYYELALGGLPPFPHWMQVLFSAYDWFFVAGLLALPKPEASNFTPRHVGNLVLIICTLIVAYVIALLEPASMPIRNAGANAVIALHCVGLASMFITALYLLWSYRWRAAYWPLVFVVLGSGIHTATYVAFVHQMMTKSYLANDWFNASWLFVFGSFACAAYERIWQATHAPEELPGQTQRRERWLEAFTPALLIAVMLSVAWTYSAWITQRVAAWATVAAVLFAVVLGLREMWIQRQEQRLLAELRSLNSSMRTANRELSQSEARFRNLSADLEQRVAERTTELQQAYRELENFSYAVAHDLKAPLRSVDGFGSMLAAEYDARLDDKGRGYLQRMRQSALRMSELIDDLLAYARVERREFELAAISLPSLIDKVVAEQRDEIERYGVQLKVNAPSLTVRADREGLLMACRNLVQNALKFSRGSQPPQVAINVSGTENLVCIAISDNGIGFDMSYHERIFEMFQRLHRAEDIPGTGIGLAIVRKAVERMGGRVWATSTPGAGATFFVQLQIAPAYSGA